MHRFDITKSSSTYNSTLLKSNLKNMDILLNSFKTVAFCCIVCKLGANAHFLRFYQTPYFFRMTKFKYSTLGAIP